MFALDMGKGQYSLNLIGFNGLISPLSVVKLIKNFRSHDAILKFPNERFYDSDLQPCAAPSIVNAYLNSSFLPAKKFPVVFHAVSGKDDREATSPSFFNIHEVLQVKSYVQRLKEDRRYRTGMSLSLHQLSSLLN